MHFSRILSISSLLDQFCCSVHITSYDFYLFNLYLMTCLSSLLLYYLYYIVLNYGFLHDNIDLYSRALNFLWSKQIMGCKKVVTPLLDKPFECSDVSTLKIFVYCKQALMSALLHSKALQQTQGLTHQLEGLGCEFVHLTSHLLSGMSTLYTLN